MSTTSLIVEFLISGTPVVIWVLFLIFSFIDYTVIPWSQVSPWAVFIIPVLISVTYVLGIVADHISHEMLEDKVGSFRERCLKKKRMNLLSDEFIGEDLEITRYFYEFDGKLENDEYLDREKHRKELISAIRRRMLIVLDRDGTQEMLRQISYDRSRHRILRNWFFNTSILTVSIIFFLVLNRNRLVEANFPILQSGISTAIFLPLASLGMFSAWKDVYQSYFYRVINSYANCLEQKSKSLDNQNRSHS